MKRIRLSKAVLKDKNQVKLTLHDVRIYCKGAAMETMWFINRITEKNSESRNWALLT